MAVYCVAEIHEAGKPPKKCGAEVKPQSPKCGKPKWPHGTCWGNVSCSHCGAYLMEPEPWLLDACTACKTRLHGGEMSSASLGLH